mmetsp:Transcript_6781/g.19627  ORF Transcript_6781/g.19627 Transcript_6781/m.19627 type:complete len:517 (-) Transcript_6781:165-1715(-)|eukprot:CAMPEP_0118875622 /NCGR_PEP_ID=MMETSP1163-20130328/16628_1 /TAXON_ID=124430 /ORGANISM="Phaeomonas parva, Strain CCMP2877" /LENGTH=516 /DNA_ID=CAMNT_0006811141 /DNA_START=192 /DNA_END=1742 /DNA_ORIENTATION=+
MRAVTFTARRAAAAAARRGLSSQTFPVLSISAKDVTARGSFAEAQASFLEPDASVVEELRQAVKAANLGVVAHFYMDAELQGALSRLDWPHVFIADSLAMGDAAVRQAEAGATAVAVLGVDFMAESVRATLDAQGWGHIPVYRLSENKIGCSLAESAEAQAYGAWLAKASRNAGAGLHVVYINTSLRCKAAAHGIVPTITCTSSNVVKTILTAAAQVPELTIWYGPDTYMGENLRSMLKRYAELDDAQIAELHPAHSRETLNSLLQRFEVFPQGNCVVHHMFGGDVVDRVAREHPDAYISAHLEVPGEMFELAMAAKMDGRGVVGSTSDILGFIRGKAQEAAQRVADGEGEQRVSVVLGTESGMISSIVDGVQGHLRDAGAAGEEVEVDIVFPVASEAVTAVDGGLGVVPGVPAGEGCSTAGGCATCPYMKMNDLDALVALAERVAENPEDDAVLRAHRPRQLAAEVAAQGAEPIMHMRSFMNEGQLPDALVADVHNRTLAEADLKESLQAWASGI